MSNKGNDKPLVKMVDIEKRFGSVQALKGVDFEVYPGEVVGLVGDNGAGKSTLMRILTGIYHPSRGDIYFRGEKVLIDSPKKARDMGIEVVHQGFGLLDSMTVARNVFLASEPLIKVGPVKLLDMEKMNMETRKVIEHAGIRTGVEPDSIVQYLSGGQRQAVKIGRAIYFKAEVVILDEPTIALSIREKDHVGELVNDLRKHNVAVIYISHDLEEVYELADKITILDVGEKLAEYKRGEVSLEVLYDIIREGRIPPDIKQQNKKE
ncbi:MAG: sugar ABC transporter ATP-binding protein [Spirochaetes bacterium]|nr:MAG: sugar ABC transporter ATP-binding protein [Spirochaetota bacterium]